MELIFNEYQQSYKKQQTPQHFNNKESSECRICLQGSQPLIVPCKCDGTVKYVHQHCVIQWGNQIIKKKLKKQQEECQFQQTTQIQCQICKQSIQLAIEWKDIYFGFEQAIQKAGGYFWPLFIINVLILIIGVLAIVLMFAIIMMVLQENNRVDYQRYKSDPFYMWGITTFVMAFALIFIFKSIKDLRNMFTKKQFSIKGVLLKQNNSQLLSQHIKPWRKQQLQGIQIRVQNGLQFYQSQTISPRSKKLKIKQAENMRNMKLSQVRLQQASTRHEITLTNRQTQKSRQQQIHIISSSILS